MKWTNVLSKIMSVTTRSEKLARVMSRSASNTSHFMQLLTSFDTTLEQSQISIYSFYETQEMVSEGQPSLVSFAPHFGALRIYINVSYIFILGYSARQCSLPSF